jgi:hypothetical protein
MVSVPSAALVMRIADVLRVVLKEVGLNPTMVAKITKEFLERWRNRGVEIADDAPGAIPPISEDPIIWEYTALTLSRERARRGVRPLVLKLRDGDQVPETGRQELAAYLNAASEDGWAIKSVLGGEQSATVILCRPKPGKQD